MSEMIRGSSGKWVQLARLVLLTSMGCCGALNAGAAPSEPRYCSPAYFDEAEVQLEALGLPDSVVNDKTLVRTHVFRLGKVTLVGVGVGDSKPAALKALAQKLAPQAVKSKYCTWYLNHPKNASEKEKVEASKTFVFKDIPKNPREMTVSEAEEVIPLLMDTVFDQDPISFLSCASEQHYVAMGCNGMKHRGPTVFGMLLAFSGCTPEHALEITNQVWGLNGVKRKVRLAAIKKAFEQGGERAESRKKLAELLSQP